MIDGQVQTGRGMIGRATLIPVLLGVAVFGRPLPAQIVQPTAGALAELDQRIEAEMAENRIPGVLVGVASRGRLLHVKGYGMADVELRVPVSDSTVFEIGSISKQFVAVAVMLLVGEGRLGLDDPIQSRRTRRTVSGSPPRRSSGWPTLDPWTSSQARDGTTAIRGTSFSA
jgi:CubicO group peptidase (beta-lactamase class C family)